MRPGLKISEVRLRQTRESTAVMFWKSSTMSEKIDRR